MRERSRDGCPAASEVGRVARVGISAPSSRSTTLLHRNPVMLTALAVVHWNERRLPEQRADLYESILTWLARAREQRQGGSRPTDAWSCWRTSRSGCGGRTARARHPDRKGARRRDA